MSFRYGGKTYSQHGEDILIVDIFAQLGIDNPSYIDLGAHHPDEISTTKLLYERGSRGINVEANPNLIAAFIDKRPDDITIRAAIVPPTLKGQLVPFYMFDNYSGLNTFSKADADIFREQSGREYFVGKSYIGQSLNDLLNLLNSDFPHFLNCDIEGFDYEILCTSDFSKSKPVVICVETRMHNTEAMCRMMTEQGFRPYCRMGENIIFIEFNHQAMLVRDLFGYY